jgi:hypothetical protein
MLAPGPAVPGIALLRPALTGIVDLSAGATAIPTTLLLLSPPGRPLIGLYAGQISGFTRRPSAAL